MKSPPKFKMLPSDQSFPFQPQWPIAVTSQDEFGAAKRKAGMTATFTTFWELQFTIYIEMVQLKKSKIIVLGNWRSTPI